MSNDLSVFDSIIFHDIHRCFNSNAFTYDCFEVNFSFSYENQLCFDFMQQTESNEITDLIFALIDLYLKKKDHLPWECSS